MQHLQLAGIFFVVGYLVGSDLCRIFLSWRRIKQLDRRIERLTP